MEADDDVSVPKTARIPKPRPDGVAKTIEAGLAELAQLRHDRDQAMHDRDEAVKRMQAAMAMCDRAKEHILDLKSRMTMYQLERDEAVTRFSTLQERMRVARRAFDDLEMPPSRVQTVASDVEAPVDAPRPPSHDDILARINNG